MKTRRQLKQKRAPVEAEARQLKQKRALASTAYALASAGPMTALRGKHECRMTDCDDC